MTTAIDDLLDELTLEEKVSLLAGGDVWRTVAVDRLGIAAIKVTDGPNGARGDSTTGARAVCLPASIALAATFDTALVEEVGHLLGLETQRKGAHVLLAPTINIAKHPLGGRNFESFGEDPRLTSAMAVAYIRGVQSIGGVGACAKHFVANDVEYARLTVSSEVDERTLREVYLQPFEDAVGEGVWSLMAAYPKLNGEHCTEHPWLLTDLLRDEWAFEGLVMSDWGATHDAARPVNAGLDLEMPGPPIAFGSKLLAAVEAGEVSIETLDQRVRRVLELVVRSERLGVMDEPSEQSVDRPEEQAIARAVAAAGMVLLRNESVEGVPTLPLEPTEVQSVALIGPNADPGVIQGGGSAELPAHHVSTPRAALAEVFTSVSHHPGCLSHRYLPLIPESQWEGEADDRLVRELFAGPDLEGEPVLRKPARSVHALVMGEVAGVPDPMMWSQRYTGRLRIDTAGLHRFSTYAVGRSRVYVDGALVVDNWTETTPGDGFFQKATSEIIGSIDLRPGTVEIVVEWSRSADPQLAGIRLGWLPPIDEEALMNDAIAAAAGADAAVVIVGLDADWETESHDRLMFGLPGRQDELVRRVAAANPRTVVVLNAGGPVDLPWLDEVPCTVVAWYPGQEFGGALGDLLTGAVDASGRLPVTFPKRMADAPTFLDVPGDGDLLHYREGLHVGHRWYDARNIEPRAEFGFGLSYATFDIGAPDVLDAAEGGGLTTSFDVANTSDRDGVCVVQAYVEPPAGAQTRPLRHLGGFVSIRLAAGERQRARLHIPDRAFEIWTAEQGWHTPDGTYCLHLGTSSRALLHTISHQFPLSE